MSFTGRTDGSSATSRLERAHGGVPRAQPGAPWWAYQRPPSTSEEHQDDSNGNGHTDDNGNGNGHTPESNDNGNGHTPESNDNGNGNGNGHTSRESNGDGHVLSRTRRPGRATTPHTADTNGNGTGSGSIGSTNGHTPLASLFALESNGHAPSSTASSSPGAQTGHLPSGVPGFLAVVAIFVTVYIGTRSLGHDSWGAVLFPVAGIFGARAFGNRCARVHPDEPWLPRLLMWGVIAKMGMSYARYVTLTQGYGGIGDATEFDTIGRKFVAFWVGERATEPILLDHRETNFIRFITGHIYYNFGQSLIGAFFLFGLIALLGSYFWYRALSDSVPYANKRLFLIFMLFAPSVVFWPSSLGKEALMQVGVGAMAWATALMLTRGPARAILPAFGGGLLLWIVRPHLLALVTIAAAVPYFLGRVKKDGKAASILSRPIGMVVVGLLVVFTISAGAKFLELDDLSVSGVQQELEDTSARTAYGGSTYTPTTNFFNPLFVPLGFVTVLFRPLPWETSSPFQLVAALESTIVVGIAILRLDSIKLGLRRCRQDPFLLYCITLLLLYSVTFSSFANFGLLNRQRSLVLPALYAFISLEPTLAGVRRRAPEPEPLRFGVPPAQ